MAVQRSRVGLAITLSLVIGVVAWGFYGSSFHGGVARPGGLVILRWCWPLLVSLAVPLVFTWHQLRKAERTLNTVLDIEAARQRLADAERAIRSYGRPSDG
jgi:hypothetical protein